MSTLELIKTELDTLPEQVLANLMEVIQKYRAPRTQPNDGSSPTNLSNISHEEFEKIRAVWDANEVDDPEAVAMLEAADAEDDGWSISLDDWKVQNGIYT